jgi:hypothetical protein
MKTNRVNPAPGTDKSVCATRETGVAPALGGVAPTLLSVRASRPRWRSLVALGITLLFALACHRAKVPTEEFLLRVDGPWQTPAAMKGQRIRSAPATIVYFRDIDNEYFELHFTVIEQNDETLYISGNLPRASALGHWEKDGDTVHVMRSRISRGDVAQFLCAPLTFKISGHSLTGNAGGTSDGMYAPVTRLVAPDFQSYLKEARQSRFLCPGVKQ